MVVVDWAACRRDRVLVESNARGIAFAKEKVHAYHVHPGDHRCSFRHKKGTLQVALGHNPMEHLGGRMPMEHRKPLIMVILHRPVAQQQDVVDRTHVRVPPDHIGLQLNDRTDLLCSWVVVAHEVASVQLLHQHARRERVGEHVMRRRPRPLPVVRVHCPELSNPVLNLSTISLELLAALEPSRRTLPALRDMTHLQVHRKVMARAVLEQVGDHLLGPTRGRSAPLAARRPPVDDAHRTKPVERVPVIHVALVLLHAEVVGARIGAHLLEHHFVPICEQRVPLVLL